MAFKKKERNDENEKFNCSHLVHCWDHTHKKMMILNNNPRISKGSFVYSSLFFWWKWFLISFDVLSLSRQWKIDSSIWSSWILHQSWSRQTPDDHSKMNSLSFISILSRDANSTSKLNALEQIKITIFLSTICQALLWLAKYNKMRRNRQGPSFQHLT